MVKVVVSEVVYMLPQSVIGHPGCGWMYVAMNYSWVLKMKYGHSTPHPTEKVISLMYTWLFQIQTYTV